MSPYANSLSNATMENMFLYRHMPIRLAMRQWKICFSTANQTAITEKGRGHAAIELICEIPCKLVLPSHKISIYEDVLTPHIHRRPHTCCGKTLFFRYRRNLLQQQGIVAAHSYARKGHYLREMREEAILTQTGCAGSA